MKSKNTKSIPQGESSKKFEKIKINNPFEVHINRAKHKVLGQKIKGELGLPGVSRRKAISKREKILLPKYRDRYKETRFLDKRIGERNKDLDPDEILLMRIAAGKKKQFSRKSFFLLNDDDELTHAGKALDEDVMKDQSLFSDDDDNFEVDNDDKDRGRLSSDFIKSQHFGGGVLIDPVKSADDKTEKNEGAPKTRKEWLDEMVAESKKKKAANKHEKEIQNEAVSQLDSKFQDFLSLMKGRALTDEDKEKFKKTCDFRDYDMAVNEFTYDRSRRACPTDRLKTVEEIAKEEKKRLEELEKDRQRRMKGEVENTNDYSATSADRLNDGYEVFTGNQNSSLPSKNSEQLSVNSIEKPKADVKIKGSIRMKPVEEDNDKRLKKGRATEGGEEESEMEEDEEESEAEEEEEECEVNEGEESEMNEGGEESEVEEGEEVSEVEEESEAEEGEESDGEQGEEGIEGDEVYEVHEMQGENLNLNVSKLRVSENEDKEDKYTQMGPLESEDEGIEKQMKRVKTKGLKPTEEERLLKLKKMMEKAKQEIPFTFEVPTKFDEFWTLFLGRKPSEVSTIVQRIIKCNHPSLGADNGMKANTIFSYLLQTLHNVCSFNSEELYPDIHPMAYIDPLVPYLYELTQLNYVAAAETLNQVIDEKYQEYISHKSKTYPYSDTFIFLKVSGILFPASDFCHQVMSRVFVFLIQLLGQARVTSGREVIASLFTCSLLSEYLNRSAKFVGELINTLNGLLYLSIPDGSSKLSLPLNPPFKPLTPSAQLLVLEDSFQKASSLKLKFSLLNDDTIEVDDNFKVGILNETLKLLDQLCHKWAQSPAVRAIFASTTLLVKNIPQDRYSPETIALIEALQKSISQLPKQVPHLFKENHVRSLRMLTPVSMDVFDSITRRGETKELREREKLEYKLKRERKAARRELKIDAQFLGRQRLKETLQSDADRKKKVNIIMAGLASQESEYQKWKKMKRK